jgi:ribosomal protein S18 acetylase RimI-like enzyme
LRHATDDDLEARVDVHRDAWSVWGRSKITVESYRLLRSAPLYLPELDVVLEDATGRFLSYCIGWQDAANGIGHFEPVGCRPDSTGRGYARAVTLEAMRRMKSRGLHTALVSTASVNERARVLYPSSGFLEVDRAYFYTKQPAG